MYKASSSGSLGEHLHFDLYFFFSCHSKEQTNSAFPLGKI